MSRIRPVSAAGRWKQWVLAETVAGQAARQRCGLGLSGVLVPSRPALSSLEGPDGCNILQLYLYHDVIEATSSLSAGLPGPSAVGSRTLWECWPHRRPALAPLEDPDDCNVCRIAIVSFS